MKKAGEDMTVNEIADKKRGCPLLLGCELDKQVQAYLILLCENGPVINTARTMASYDPMTLFFKFVKILIS